MAIKDVLVEVQAELLSERQLRSDKEVECKKLQMELNKVNKLKEKYYEFYKHRSDALKASLADRAVFAKKATDLEKEKRPQGLLNKLLFLIKH